MTRQRARELAEREIRAGRADYCDECKDTPELSDSATDDYSVILFLRGERVGSITSDEERWD